LRHLDCHGRRPVVLALEHPWWMLCCRVWPLPLCPLFCHAHVAAALPRPPTLTSPSFAPPYLPPHAVRFRTSPA
jgi:hypothetical protein